MQKSTKPHYPPIYWVASVLNEVVTVLLAARSNDGRLFEIDVSNTNIGAETSNVRGGVKDAR